MLFLVVDDDALSRELLTLLLEVEGYDVEVAASGEAAIARLASCAHDGLSQPGVILTDIQMPGLAGNALAAALQPLLASGTLLLAMSGSQPAASALTGFDGFLLKPFKVSELTSLIDAAAPINAATALSRAEAHDLASVSGPSSASADQPAIDALDEEIYEKMCELMPTAQLGQMYALCVDDARKRIARMQSLASAGDDAQYRSEAHAVKGGCGMIGARELYEIAAAAEQDGLVSKQIVSETALKRIAGTTSVTATLTQLSLACDRLERILQERTKGQERTRE